MVLNLVDHSLAPSSSSHGNQSNKGKAKCVASGPSMRQPEPGWMSGTNITVSQEDMSRPAYPPTSETAVPKLNGRIARRQRIVEAEAGLDPQPPSPRAVHARVNAALEVLGEALENLPEEEACQALDKFDSFKAHFRSNLQRKARRRATAHERHGVLRAARTGTLRRTPEVVLRKITPKPQTRTGRTNKRTHQQQATGSSGPPEDDEDEVDNNLYKQARRYRSVNLDNEEEVKAYVMDCCESVQQLAAKHILKQWMKHFWPKKQSECPYSSKKRQKSRGSKPRKDSSQLITKDQASSASSVPLKLREWGGSPENIPEFWPDEVIYIEPDHIDKPSRKLLFWGIINYCAEEKGGKIARKVLDQTNADDHFDHVTPWTDVLRSSTPNRNELRATKEKNDPRSPENKAKLEFRSQVLDALYEVSAGWETHKNETPAPGTVLHLLEPLDKDKRSKTQPNDRKTSTRSKATDQDTADDTEAEDLYEAYTGHADETIASESDHSYEPSRNSFTSSRKASPRHRNLPLRASRRTSPAPVSATTSFGSMNEDQYEPTPMVERLDLARSNPLTTARTLSRNAFAPDTASFSLGLPQASYQRDSMDATQHSSIAPEMAWSQLHRPHDETPSSYTPRMSETVRHRPHTYERTELALHTQNQHPNFGPECLTNTPWQQPPMLNTSFGSYDDMPAMGQTVAYPVQQADCYFQPASEFDHQTMPEHTQQMLIDQRAQLHYAENWSRHQSMHQPPH